MDKVFAEFMVGDQASFNVKIDKALVDRFAELSGDFNPLHMDDQYAKNTQFGKRVAHGMISACLFSRLVGMYLPGLYCLLLSQTLNFKNPIFLDMEVVVKGEVIGKNDAFKTLEIKNTIKSTDGSTLFVEGRSLVKLLR